MDDSRNIIQIGEEKKGDEKEVLSVSSNFLARFYLEVKELTDQFVECVQSKLRPLLQTPCGQTFMEFEQALLTAGVDLAAKTTGSFLEELHQCTTWPIEVAAIKRQQEPSLVHKGRPSTPVRLLNGSLQHIKTPYLLAPSEKKRKVGQRGEAGNGCYPVLEALGIEAQATPALRSEVAQTVMRVASYEEAKTVLEQRGCPLNLKIIQRLAQRVADDAVSQQDARLEAAKQGIQFSNEFAGKRLLIGVDGGRVRTRVYRRRGRKRKSGRRGFEGKWREPKLYVVYVLDDNGKPIKKGLPLYDATMGDADFAFELLVAELQLRGAGQAKEIIVTSDGALWIWNRTDELAQKLGLDESQVNRVLDFYHVCERLTEVMDCCKNLGQSEKKKWYQTQRQLLLKGRWPEVLRAIRLLCKGKRSQTIKEHLRYLEKKKEFIDYKRCKELGMPRGSGATESAIRRVINLRLKGAGCFWLLENVDRMLHLRAALKSGRWSEMYRRVIHKHPNGEAPQLPAIIIGMGLCQTTP